MNAKPTKKKEGEDSVKEGQDIDFTYTASDPFDSLKLSLDYLKESIACT